MNRCLFALLILAISRLFFLLYLKNYFTDAPLKELPLVFIIGILFDFQALVYFLGIFHLLSLMPFNFTNKKYYQVILQILFTVGLGFIILMNCIDTEFYKIKTRRSGIELFTMIADPANSIGKYLKNYWWMFLVFIIFIFLIIYSYPKQKRPQKYQKPLITFLITIFASAFLVLGARGGFYKKPIRSFDAARFVDAQWVSATINSPTQLLTSYNAQVPSNLNYFSDEEATKIYNPVHQITPFFEQKEQPNIVLIILESFGRDYCGFLNTSKRYTPFLDSLSKSSISFTNAYSSGTTSMECIPAIFTSLPSLLEVPFINSNFQNNKLHGIHYYLAKNGYDCSFYYGADNGSMGFDNYLKINGPINYRGLNEYPSKVSDHDGNWGIWDEPYLQYFADELARKKAPFFSTVFTLTSHDPYIVPKAYKNKFKDGDLPIHKSIQYTDYALSQFFEKAKKKFWFRNTIFIITADHPSHSTNSYFYMPMGRFEIPLLIYSPKYFKKAATDSATVSHCDIMPTILSFAGYNNKVFGFGQNLFDTTRSTAINNINGITQVIQYPYCLQLLPNSKMLMHIQRKNWPNKNVRYTMMGKEKELQEKLELELKAKQQLYINHLLDNTFFVD